MKVQLGGKEYWIEFEYGKIEFGRVDIRSATRFGQKELTRCIIRENQDRAPGTPAPIVAEAHVVRYFKDPPNREVARKAALKKALDEFALSWLATDQSWTELPGKARRKLFWDAYLGRKKPAVAKAGN